MPSLHLGSKEQQRSHPLAALAGMEADAESSAGGSSAASEEISDPVETDSLNGNSGLDLSSDECEEPAQFQDMVDSSAMFS